MIFKKWYFSKMIWFNILIIIVACAIDNTDRFYINPLDFTLAMGIGNILLRWFTNGYIE